MSAIDKNLAAIEAQLDALARALQAGAPEPMERLGASLHQSLLELGRVRADQFAPAQRARCARCRDRLGQIRLNLSRRNAANDRQLATLLPQTRPATYQALNPALAGRRLVC